jgi:cellulose binding protein with CBM2 domain
MRKRRRRLVPVLVSLAVAGLLSILTGTAMAASGSSTPDATSRSAPLGGQVPGLTGAAAQQDAGEAADRFRDLTTERVRRAAAAAAPAAAAPAAAAPAATLHTAWGIFFNDRASQGLQATHSVLTVTTHNNDFVYAPTALPPGGACTEMTTAYTPSGPKLWAWDWCGGRDAIGKIVNIDSSFLSTYTTTVNGQQAYTMQEVLTSAASNAWTVYLFDYTTRAWDTFYATSGTKDIPGSTWDFFEIYTDVDPATGAGYYCADANGKAFEASSVQVSQNGVWTPATTSNSSLSSPPSGSSLDCPSLAFSIAHANDHWIARIGQGAPPSSAPPSSARPSATPTGTGTAGGCTATYSQVGSWQGGFQGNVTVSAGSAGVNGWTVKLTMPSGDSVTQLWSGVLSGSAPNYTVKNETYNGVLAGNASTVFGFLASGTAATPTLSCSSP